MTEKRNTGRGGFSFPQGVGPAQQDEMIALAQHVAELTSEHIRLEEENVPLEFKYRQQALLEYTIQILQRAV